MVLMDFLKGLFGAKKWPKVHRGFCFDTEYISHYESWLEDPKNRETLKNSFMIPPKFHFCKHVAETVLASRFNLVEFFSPLLRSALRTSLIK
jgi:hypothetical protein